MYERPARLNVSRSRSLRDIVARRSTTPRTFCHPANARWSHLTDVKSTTGRSAGTICLWLLLPEDLADVIDSDRRLNNGLKWEMLSCHWRNNTWFHRRSKVGEFPVVDIFAKSGQSNKTWEVISVSVSSHVTWVGGTSTILAQPIYNTDL